MRRIHLPYLQSFLGKDIRIRFVLWKSLFLSHYLMCQRAAEIIASLSLYSYTCGKEVMSL
nr:MAG TPA: hypothetical protein [Siphoviridae sp. ct7ub6]